MLEKVYERDYLERKEKCRNIIKKIQKQNFTFRGTSSQDFNLAYQEFLDDLRDSQNTELENKFVKKFSKFVGGMRNVI